MTIAMTSDRVVIIGASTAGLFAACLLAKKRIPVQVYDQHERLGQPSRTLIVTGKLTEVLAFIPHEAILNRVHRIELLSAGQRALVSLQEPDVVIERQRLIELLARKAGEEGAEIYPDFKFLGLEDEGDGLVVSLENGATGEVRAVTTNVLIGADGVFSEVAEAVSRNSRETVALLQAKVVLPQRTSGQCVKVWFDRGRTQYFHWLIPESDSRAVIGLISRNGGSARESLQHFVESQGCEMLELQAGRAPLHDPFLEPWRALPSSRILLIGDAGGQVKTTTVGGLVAGLRGARAAVRAIVARAPYRKALRPLKRELDLQLILRAVLNGFRDQDYDRLLELLNGRTRNVLAVHNRDEFRRSFFKLLLSQPQLLLLAGKSLLNPNGPTES
jgi:flavin-dependent dehydrogenase